MVRSRTHVRAAIAAIGSLLVVVPVNLPGQIGAGVYAYPAQGQSPEQQARDTRECHEWAIRETGFDPATALAPAQRPPGQAPTGEGSIVGLGSQDTTVVHDAAKGAAAGAIGGAIAGSAGTGAAIGALAGALFGGITRSSQEQERERWRREQEADMASEQQRLDADRKRRMEQFRRAYSACMTARQYSVQ